MVIFGLLDIEPSTRLAELQIMGKKWKAYYELTEQAYSHISTMGFTYWDILYGVCPSNMVPIVFKLCQNDSRHFIFFS